MLPLWEGECPRCRGWGLFRLGESPEEVPPFAVTPSPWLAWVLATVLPSLGRDAAYRLDKERGSEGFAVRDRESSACRFAAPQEG